MQDEPRVKYLLALVMAGLVFVLVLYLPPPGPLALLIFNHPLPLRVGTEKVSFLITVTLILCSLWVLFLLAISFSRELIGEDICGALHKLFDKTSLGPFDKWGLIISVATLISLPFLSFHYVALGVALTLVFIALMKCPAPPREMGEPPSPLVAAIVSGQNIGRKSYAWAFDFDLGDERPIRKAEFLELFVDLDSYAQLKGKNSSRTRALGPGDLAEFVGHGVTPEVQNVADHLRQTTRSESLCSFLEVLNAISFVQSPEAIPYKSDLETTGIEDYWRYPLETLVDQAGDCECKSILAAAVLKLLGRHVLFLIYPPKADKPGHMALAIEGAGNFPPGLSFFQYGGARYFYSELTAEGMLPGEIPPSLRKEAPEVFVIPSSNLAGE